MSTPESVHDPINRLSEDDDEDCPDSAEDGPVYLLESTDLFHEPWSFIIASQQFEYLILFPLDAGEAFFEKSVIEIFL